MIATKIMMGLLCLILMGILVTATVTFWEIGGWMRVTAIVFAALTILFPFVLKESLS
jgi:hypothetical protein